MVQYQVLHSIKYKHSLTVLIGLAFLAGSDIAKVGHTGAHALPT